MKQNKEQIIQSLYNLCIKLNRKINVKDINRNNGFDVSYNTLLRNGISLLDFKFDLFLYNNKPNQCKCCKNKIPFEKRFNFFCSMSCSSKINNKYFIKRPSKYPEKECLWCLKYIGRKKYNCCSIECYKKYNFMLSFIDWYYTGNNNNPKSLKSFLETIYGYKCVICENNNHDGESIVLELDHIDGNYLNNNIKNIRLLCPNCHSQTENFSGKNRGKSTRTWRMKRYKNKQSH